MPLEDRLYAVTKETVGGSFKTYFEIAQRVHEARPPEFSYNRLGEVHVMQPESIVVYVSLLHLLEIIKRNDAANMYSCILRQEPNLQGVQQLIVRAAIEKMEYAGFTREAFLKIVKKMLRPASLIIPTLKDIYREMSLNMAEHQFLQLSTLGGVRQHFGFTIVTRRMMLPT